MIHNNLWFNFTVVVLLLIGLHYALISILGIQFDLSVLLIHGFFFVISILGSLFLFKNLKRVQSFMQKFFGFTTLKLLVSFGVLAIFIFNYGKENSVQFVVSFVILYLVYTGFESAYIIKKFKSVSNELNTNPR